MIEAMSVLAGLAGSRERLVGVTQPQLRHKKLFRMAQRSMRRSVPERQSWMRRVVF